MKENLAKIFVLAIALGVVAGCGGKKIGNMKESDFIEVNAQLMVISSTESDPMVMKTKMDEVFEKYGTSAEEISKLSQDMSVNDTETMKKIGPKIMERAKELGAK